jgi:outer membrane protein OmpA-like peptidoglycan-associated protein
MRAAGSTLLALVLTLLAAPEARAQLRDMTGSQDHPMISRYEGSTILADDIREFDEFVLPLGPVRRLDTVGGVGVEPSESRRIEGKLTRILYVAPAGRSPLEVLRNYEQGLSAAGFETLFACSGRECGEGDGDLGERYLYSRNRELSDAPPGASGVPGQISEFAFSFPRDQRYLAARLARPEGDVYASVYVATETFNHFPETKDHALVLLDVIETVPMESEMVTVDAAAMARDIANTGHVAVYGILFDTDKSDIKPESEPTLREVAELLNQDAALKVYVVGHTDNVGGFDYNMDLSQRRAAAVVGYLTGEHGIQAARLAAAGVGMLAPVASNDTDEGRAKNRRVELVRQ